MSARPGRQRAPLLVALCLCALLGATCPGIDCACTPLRTHAQLVVVATDSTQPVAGAVVRLRVAPSIDCADSAYSLALDPPQATTGANGRAHVLAYSSFGAPHQCVYATGVRVTAGITDSVRTTAVAAFTTDGSAATDSILIYLAFP